jgi:hypothetical protein
MIFDEQNIHEMSAQQRAYPNRMLFTPKPGLSVWVLFGQDGAGPRRTIAAPCNEKPNKDFN